MRWPDDQFHAVFRQLLLIAFGKLTVSPVGRAAADADAVRRGRVHELVCQHKTAKQQHNGRAIGFTHFPKRPHFILLAFANEINKPRTYRHAQAFGNWLR